MVIDEAITSLRDNAVSQRRAQICLEGAKWDWFAGPASDLANAMERYAAGADLADCPCLAQLLQSHQHADECLAVLTKSLANGLIDFPLGQIPFRHQYQQGLGVLQIISAGNAALSLVLYEPSDLALPQSACFTDSECHEIIMAGGGIVRLLQIDGPVGEAVRITQSNVDLAVGDTLMLDGFGKTKQMISVEGRMVALRLSRTSKVPQQVREYRLSDGVLLHLASGDRNDSRQEMYVTLLGAMGRKDAVPVLGDIASVGSNQLRWQAVRNGLAMDSAAGFQMLRKMADDPEDDLFVPASALKAQLIKQYPQLATIEADLCPA